MLHGENLKIFKPKTILKLRFNIDERIKYSRK